MKTRIFILGLFLSFIFVLKPLASNPKEGLADKSLELASEADVTSTVYLNAAVSNSNGVVLVWLSHDTNTASPTVIDEPFDNAITVHLVGNVVYNGNILYNEPYSIIIPANSTNNYEYLPFGVEEVLDFEIVSISGAGVNHGATVIVN